MNNCNWEGAATDLDDDIAGHCPNDLDGNYIIDDAANDPSDDVLYDYC